MVFTPYYRGGKRMEEEGRGCKRMEEDERGGWRRLEETEEDRKARSFYVFYFLTNYTNPSPDGAIV